MCRSGLGVVEGVLEWECVGVMEGVVEGVLEC